MFDILLVFYRLIFLKTCVKNFNFAISFLKNFEISLDQRIAVGGDANSSQGTCPF
jgi:hypothetical protein